VIICVAAGILFSLYLHLVVAGSALQFDSETWLKAIHLHKDIYPYNIRPLQTYSTILFHQISGFPLKESFYVIQYLLAFLTGLLFYNYLKKLEFSSNWSLFGVALLMLSLPIAAAFFEPVHTYDDFWMYGFTVLTFIAIISRRWLLSALFFTLGCFAREQMLLFYPVLLMVAWGDRKDTDLSKTILWLLLPLITYGSYYLFMYEPGDPKRWSLINYNFANSTRAADSTISIWNAFGFLWILATVGAIKAWKKRRELIERLCFRGAVIAVPLTLGLGIFFTLVRETRILFPTFVFVIPLGVYAIRDDWSKLPKIRSTWFWTKVVIMAGLLIFIGIQLANWLWPEFDYGASTDLRRNFAGVNIGLAILYLWFLLQTRLRPVKS